MIILRKRREFFSWSLDHYFWMGVLQLGFVICKSVDLAQGSFNTQQTEQHAFYIQEAQIGPATGFLPSWTTRQMWFHFQWYCVLPWGSHKRQGAFRSYQHYSPVVSATELTWVKVICLCIFWGRCFCSRQHGRVNIDHSLTLRWK